MARPALHIQVSAKDRKTLHKFAHPVVSSVACSD